VDMLACTYRVCYFLSNLSYVTKDDGSLCAVNVFTKFKEKPLCRDYVIYDLVSATKLAVGFSYDSV
jgi:hypothetical protein